MNGSHLIAAFVGALLFAFILRFTSGDESTKPEAPSNTVTYSNIVELSNGGMSMRSSMGDYNGNTFLFYNGVVIQVRK